MSAEIAVAASRDANASNGRLKRCEKRPKTKLPRPRPAKKAVSAAAAAGAVDPRSTEKRRIHRTSYASAAAPEKKNRTCSAAGTLSGRPPALVSMP